MLHLKWHFCNENMDTYQDMCKSKSKINTRNNNITIELYLSRLEEKIMQLRFKKTNSTILLVMEKTLKAYDPFNFNRHDACAACRQGSLFIKWILISISFIGVTYLFICLMLLPLYCCYFIHEYYFY